MTKQTAGFMGKGNKNTAFDSEWGLCSRWKNSEI